MKRLFDIYLCLLLLSILIIPLGFLIVLAKIYNGGTGIFKQKRIGLYGKSFVIYKLQTFCLKTNKINKVGHFLRRYKLDEIPQLFNILKGEMSFVGPRPEVLEYLEWFRGDYVNILKLKPGLTGPSTLKYVNEETILSEQENSKLYNDSVIYPDKMKINLEYYYNNSRIQDLKIIIKSVIKIFF